MNRQVEGRKKREGTRIISRKPIEQKPIDPKLAEPKEPEPMENGTIVIEQNPEPKSMVDKQKVELEKKREIKRKWAIEHRDIVTKNVKISKLRTWLLKHNKAKDYEQATQKAKDFISKGIDSISKLSEYYIAQAKEQEQKQEAPKQKPEETKEMSK